MTIFFIFLCRYIALLILALFIALLKIYNCFNIRKILVFSKVLPFPKHHLQYVAIIILETKLHHIARLPVLYT